MLYARVHLWNVYVSVYIYPYQRRIPALAHVSETSDLAKTVHILQCLNIIIHNSIEHP